MNTGQIIKSKRQAAQLTQEQLAQRSGVATVTIRQYETGKRQPRLEQLQSIANALEVPIGELLGMSDVDAFIAEFDEKTQAEFLNDELKRRLDRSLEKLSETGRMEAVKRVEEMTYIPDYQKQKTPPEAPQEAPEGE